MNKIERVRSTLADLKTDRPPVSFWFHFPQEKARGLASVNAHLVYYRKVDIDFLKVMNEHPYQTDIEIKTPEDWKKIKPAPISSDFYQQQLDKLKLILDKIQGDCLVITTIFNPFSSANHASNNLVMDHIRENPLVVNEGFKKIAESLAEFSQKCLEAGAAGIYYSAQGGENYRFHEDEFLQYIKPHDLTVLNAIQSLGEFNLLHICKDNIRLPLYRDYPANAVNWAVTKNSVSLEEGKALFQRPIVGGFDDRGVIVNGSAIEIQSATRKILNEAPTTGFMIGADCTLPTDISLENICLVLNTVCK